MDALKCIYSRRSIRAYDADRKVPKEALHNLIAAGCSAPSAHNGRPWEFIVVQDKSMIAKLGKVKVYYEKPLRDAPLAIAVLINPDFNDKEKPEYKYQDCAAATQNMMLAAKAQGLGSCWMGGLLDDDRMKELKSLLEIPDKIIFFGLISFGYPAEEKEPKGNIEENKVHYEKY